MARNINYQVNLTVNKSDLIDLLNSFKQIEQEAKQASLTGKLNDELKIAAQTAKELEHILNSSWNSKIGQLDLNKVNNSIKSTYGSVNKLRENLEHAGKSAQFNKLATEILHTNIQLKQSNKLLDELATSMSNTVKWGITSSTFNNITNQIQKAWSYSKALDTSLNSIRIVTGKSADEMERYAKVANKAAKELGQSTRDYTDASLIYYQQGLGDEEVQARTETTLKAANVTGQTGREVSEQLTAVWNGYKVNAAETELYVDKLAAVAASTASDLEELSTGMSKVASAANSAGIDIDQLNGILSTVISVTREAPETIGSSFKTIFARLGDLSLDGEDEYGVTLGKVSSQMEELGIEVLNQKGEMRDMGDIIEDTAAKWQTWTQAQKQAAAVAMAGKMQYSRLIALFDNWDKYSKAVQTSQNAIGTLQEQQDIYMESTEAHLQQLSTEFESTYDILFDTESVNDMTDAVTGLLHTFNNLFSGLGGGIQTLSTLGMMFTNLFKNQIARGINNTITNIQAMKSNAQGVELKQQLAQNIITQHSAQGNFIGEAAAQKEAEIAMKTLAVRKSLTAEQYNELNALQQQVGLAEEKIVAAQNYKVHLQGIAGLENASTQLLQKRINDNKKNIEIYRDQKIGLEEISILMRGLGRSRAEDMSIYAQIEQYENDIKGALESQDISAKLLTTFNEKLKGGTNERRAAEHILNNILQGQYQLLDNEEDQYNKINTALQLKKFFESDTYQQLLKEQQAREKLIAQQQEQAAKQQAIAGVIQGLSTIGTAISTVTGLWKTMGDESLSAREKSERFFTTALTMLPMIIMNFSSLKSLLPNIAVSFGTVTVAELEAAKAAGTFGATLWSALWPILAITAMVAASIAGIVWIVNTSIDSYNKSAQAAEEAEHQTEMLAQAYQDCAKAADDLNQAISDYEAGVKGLDKLTKGTDEYEEALKKANKQAQDLIAKYDLLAGKDYFIDPDGVIRIKTDENSGLSNKKNELEQKMSMADSKQLAAKMRANQASIDSAQLDYQRKTGIDYNSDIERQYDKIITGMGLIPGAGPLMAIGGNIAKFSSEERGYNLDKIEVNELIKVLSEAEGGYASILGDSEKDVRNWIQKNEDLSDSIKDNVDEIVKEKDALISLISSTKEFEKSLKQASEELVINHIKNNKVLDEQLNKLAKDKETGEVNEGQKELIEKALAASESASVMKSSEESDLKLAKMAADKVKSNADLENFVKNQGLDANALGLTDLNDKKSAEAYLKYVLGYSDEDIAHMKIDAGGWGKTSVKWTSNYTDSKGTTHDTDSYIYKDLNDEEARSSIAYQVKANEIIKQADQNAQIFMQDNLDAINNMMQSTQRATNQFGADFSNIILNSMAGRQDGKNANLDFTSAFKNLTDGEIDALMKMDSNKLAETLGLTDEDFWNLGYEGAAAFEKAFDEGLLQHEKQALSTLMSQITQFGSNFSETELSEDKVSSLSKSIFEKMNASDMITLSKSPLSLSQIDFNTETVEAATEKLAFMAEQIRKVTEDGIALTDTQKEQAKELNYSEDALKAYAEELQDTNDSLKDNDEATVDMALANVRMNKGIDTLANNFEHWNEVLKDGNKNSGEYYEVLSELKQATEDMFGVKVSNEFLQNADNLAKLGEIAKGNVESFDELQEAATRDYIMHLAIIAPDQATVDNIRNSILGMVNDVQSQSNIEIGTTLDPSYVDQLNEMLRKGQITEEQMNKILGGIGYSPTVRYKTVPGPETKTHHRVTANVFGNEMTVAEFTDYSQSDVQVPEIEGGTGDNSGTGPTYIGKPSSSGIDYSNNKGRQKENAKKNGGSKSEPDKMDALEDEKDRYHDIDIILKQIETDLNRLDKQKDKLFGKDLIENLNKQLETLDRQIDATNEKIRIAQGEAGELRNKLSGYGTTFNADGTIANYTQVYQSQLNYVNSLIAQYNSMSKEQQEAFKDTVETAKENFDKFTEAINNYDTLISDTIPGLQDEIQDAIDKEIEIKIEEFTMEIEIRLDLSEAERDWNEFRRKVIDGIKDNDILGNTKARLRDFSSYYKTDNTGEVQALTQQVLNTKAQLEQIDKTGTSDWYGDNRAKALEDLKSYTDQLMESLGDVEDLVQEIKDSYLDMMDEAAEKFGDQIDLYKQVRDIITHDMNVIELIYGEESYKDLEKYYEKQEENYNKQLDFNRQQKDFWYNQMIAIEKAGGKNSEAWLKAKENWMSAVSEWNSAIEEAIENLQNKYQNAINLIFQGLNDKITGGLGLEYVSEEWELINQNADQYLDTINSLYGIQDLENKYLDAIDNTDSISAQQKLNELMEEEVAALKEKDKLTQYDIDRANMKYEIALKQIALEEAQQNKSTMRLRRDSQGNYTYQYVADNDQVGQIEDELSALKNELYNFDLEHYRDNLDQVLSIYTEFQEKMAEAALINDPEERQERELLLREQYGELINGLVEQNEDIRTNLHESAFTELADLYGIEYANFQQLSEDEKTVMMEQMIPQWDSAVQHMTDTFAGNDEGEGGFLPTCRDAFKQLDEATKQYQTDLGELQQSAGTDFDNIRNGIDENISKTQELITNNDELIRSYQDQLSAIGAVISELQQLVSQYNAARDAAIAATEAAYGYWKAQQQQAANAAGKNVSSGGSNLNSGNSNSNNNNNSSGSGSGSGDSGGGASVGNKITYSGKYYYDSFGTSPAGSKYSGVADGVTIDIVNNNPYGIHVKSSDGKYPDLGWIKKSQVTRWNTGGYTGDWGDDSGRLAILDRKELVLNKEDTPNILNAVEIMRGIANSMNLSMLSRMAESINGVQNSSNSIAADSDTLEQNVHIDATFPGVKDAREIEQALNNLVNVASQRIGHNRK